MLCLAEKAEDKNQTPRNWLDDLEHDIERSEAENLALLTERKLQQLQPKHGSKDNITKSGLLTDEKLKSIISFLDEVTCLVFFVAYRLPSYIKQHDIFVFDTQVEIADRLSEIDDDIHRTNEYLDRPAMLVPSGEEIAAMEQASAAAAEVTNTVLFL